MERDFEPGNLTVPDISLMGSSTISWGFSAVATDAEILKDDFLTTLKTESFLNTPNDFAEIWVTFFDPKKREFETRGPFCVLERLEEFRLRVCIPCAMLLICAISCEKLQFFHSLSVFLELFEDQIVFLRKF